MVFKSSILLGANVEDCAKDLLDKKRISNWQKLAPTHVNTARILIIVAGGDQDYNKALDEVINEAAAKRVALRHEDYLHYGDPANQTWIPSLGIPPNFVKVERQP
jgi:hypothetical protein